MQPQEKQKDLAFFVHFFGWLNLELIQDKKHIGSFIICTGQGLNHPAYFNLFSAYLAICKSFRNIDVLIRVRERSVVSKYFFYGWQRVTHVCLVCIDASLTRTNYKTYETFIDLFVKLNLKNWVSALEILFCVYVLVVAIKKLIAKRVVMLVMNVNM